MTTLRLLLTNGAWKTRSALSMRDVLDPGKALVWIQTPSGLSPSSHNLRDGEFRPFILFTFKLHDPSGNVLDENAVFAARRHHRDYTALFKRNADRIAGEVQIVLEEVTTDPTVGGIVIDNVADFSLLPNYHGLLDRLQGTSLPYVLIGRHLKDASIAQYVDLVVRMEDDGDVCSGVIQRINWDLPRATDTSGRYTIAPSEITYRSLASLDAVKEKLRVVGGNGG